MQNECNVPRSIDCQMYAHLDFTIFHDSFKYIVINSIHETKENLTKCRISGWKTMHGVKTIDCAHLSSKMLGFPLRLLNFVDKCRLLF